MDYYFIIAGTVVSLIAFACLILRFNNKIKRITAYFISVLLAFLISRAMLKVMSDIISRHNHIAYSINYSFYFTMVLFLLISFCINKICKIDTSYTGKLIALPLAIFLAVAKLGCYFNGCCAGVVGNTVIHLNLIESLMALLTVILILTNKIKPCLYIVTVYSIFRFITDFYKVTFTYEDIFGITISQAVYLIVIAVTILTEIYYKGGKRNEA